MKKSRQDLAKKLLKPYRHKIDALDDKIMKLLGERFDTVRRVAELKAKNDLPSYLSDRVVEVRERNAKTGEKYNIDPGFIRVLYSVIIFQSCALEDTIKHGIKSGGNVAKAKRGSVPAPQGKRRIKPVKKRKSRKPE